MNRALTVVLAIAMLAPALAGCVRPVESPIRREPGPSPAPFEDVGPSGPPPIHEPPRPPEIGERDIVEAPNLTELDALLPAMPERGCPAPTSATVPDPVDPGAPAPHALTYEGPHACIAVSGVDATARGGGLSIDPVEGVFGGPLELSWPNATFDPEGPQRPLNLSTVTLDANETLELTGHAAVETELLHRVQDDAFSVTVLGSAPNVPDEIGNAFERATIHARNALEANATLLVNGTRETGVLELAPGRGHLLSGGRLTIPAPRYEANGTAPGLVQVQGLDRFTIAGLEIDEPTGLDVTRARLSYGEGNLTIDAAVEQAWRAGRPLLAAEMDAEAFEPGLLAVHEASGNATLAGLEIDVVEAPNGTDVGIGQVRDTPDPDAADAAVEVTRALAAVFTFGLSETVWDIPPVRPGQTLYAPVTADGEHPNGTAVLEVTSANGGSWTGEVPLG